MAGMRAVTAGWAGAQRWACDGASPQHGEVGDDLALDALLDDGEEQRPDIGGGAEEVAAVADAAVDLDEVPVLEFLEAGADVGTRDGKGVGDFLGGEGLGER